MTATDVDIGAIPTHVTRVVRSERISESFVRVTFGGDGLERFRPIGPDDFVYVLLPPRGRRDLTIDTSFGWSAYAEMPETERPVGAYYTVRRFRPEVGELDCDVFLHEPAGAVSRWAPDCGRGDPVALWGPRTAWSPPPATTDWLLVADETGLPAVAAILEGRPRGVRARVFVPAASEDGYERLPPSPMVDITWLRCEGGRTSSLVEAVRSAGVAPSPTTYAWGGGESHALTAVRQLLREEVGLAQAQVSMTPYWRRAD